MTDEIIRKSALFFFLLTLDDRIAIEATKKSLESYLINLKKSSGATAKNDSLLEFAVRACLDQWKLIRTRIRKDQIQSSSSKALIWPENLDLNPWKEFQKRAPENELLAVAWVHVIGIPESVLGRCLNVSEGTIRYRVGNGLALLGQLNRPNTSYSMSN